MGWTSEHRDKGTSNKDWFAAKLDGPQNKVLDAATVGGTCYIALRVNEEDASYVTALVILTQWNPHDYYNFSYKIMGESMGPRGASCPQRILDQLSPLDEIPFSEQGREWAEDWRKACVDRLADKKARGSVSAGDKILFSEAIRFTDGVEAQCFEWVRGNGFYRLTRRDGAYQRGARVGIRNWRELEWAKL